MPNENQNLELRIGINRGRAPWMNSEKIRQLKVYARETQRRIMKMEKRGNIREIILEKQLLLSIQLNLQDQKRNAIDSEFFNLDYFQKL